jgi:hypothetical protein
MLMGIDMKFKKGVRPFAGKFGCWHVETGFELTDMCLSVQHVADMLANMSATRHKKLSARVPLVLGQPVTC